MEKWKPQAGDHVYHVCEFELDSCEMRKKGMEGFKRWGYEVVESVIVDKYIWRSKAGSATIGWASELIRRDVGKVTENNKMFYWKANDFGTIAFRTLTEAAQLAEGRVKLAHAALHETRIEGRPMYRNWLHWEKAEHKVTITQGEVKAEKQELPPTEQQKSKRKPNWVAPRKAVLSEELYIQWRDGEISAAAGAEKLGVTDMTFLKYGKEMLEQRGETKKVLSRPLPENFDKMYQEWKDGNISLAKAAKACKMEYSSFRFQANKRKQKASRNHNPQER